MEKLACADAPSSEKRGEELRMDFKEDIPNYPNFSLNLTVGVGEIQI